LTVPPGHNGNPVLQAARSGAVADDVAQGIGHLSASDYGRIERGNSRSGTSVRSTTPGPGPASPSSPASRGGLGALRWHQQVDGGHVGDDREGEQLSDRDVLPPGYLQVGRIDRLMWCMPWMASRWARSWALQPRRSRGSRTRAYGCAPADASRRWRTG